LDPSDSMATENIGSVYLSENRIAEARQAFEQAVQADPRSSRAHSGLGVVQLKLGDTQAAIKSWTQAIALDPNNFDALYDLAAALVRSGDVASARPWVEQFVKTAPPALYADDIRAFSAWLARTQAQS
ncbi:MAG TPA: tetratricopeptide repeat protein, partial [Gaiellales bacterium]|nr:tetratricopeptide repeat protein [Gaiellales bacterium]